MIHAAKLAAPDASGACIDHLHRIIRTHFDPDLGAPFWLDRQASIGLDMRHEIQDFSALSILGNTSPKDLAGRPLIDFIPRRFHADLTGFILGQTGGTTGNDLWTAYRPDEFTQAFITPFAVAAAHVRFPRAERWLYIGPSGPHIIGKVVRDLAASVGSHDPFSVDFDARWAKKLPGGSFAQDRYLAHVIDQSMDIIRSQDIGVLFTTPAVLGPLSDAMTPDQRHRIRGIHYGGMEITAESLADHQTSRFPGAVHLCGYGNTLFGCCLELDDSPNRTPEYFPFGRRLLIDLVDDRGHPVAPGESGAVRITRLDQTFLLVNLLERDAATAAPLPPGAPTGFTRPGVRAPHSPASLAPKQAKGLY